MGKKVKEALGEATLQPVAVKEFFAKWCILEHELMLIKEQGKGLEEEYRNNHFGKEGMKVVKKAIMLSKQKQDLDLIKYVCDQIDDEN